ncbi:hypothetical protein ABB02_00516 [Clostridiaceae bacterium JG1575]|nr:hypothetical protein ABB02_00677 [Clostridiaceae bacterium JG1575]PKK40197.1 hypothetical protein ABB02_00516 [Clostridiaceae bacterium JG1575]
MLEGDVFGETILDGAFFGLTSHLVLTADRPVARFRAIVQEVTFQDGSTWTNPYASFFIGLYYHRPYSSSLSVALRGTDAVHRAQTHPIRTPYERADGLKAALASERLRIQEVSLGADGVLSYTVLNQGTQDVGRLELLVLTRDEHGRLQELILPMESLAQPLQPGASTKLRQKVPKGSGETLVQAIPGRWEDAKGLQMNRHRDHFLRFWRRAKAASVSKGKGP